MSVRSLNKVMLIGNLTRDPNLRYTPSGTPVCSFGLATNRSWTSSDSGEKQERVDFHNIVSWSKLAEICGQLLHKGDKVYVEGRVQTRDWKTNEGADRRITEVVIDNMILLHSANNSYSNSQDQSQQDNNKANDDSSDQDDDPSQKESVDSGDVADDIPF